MERAVLARSARARSARRRRKAPVSRVTLPKILALLLGAGIVTGLLLWSGIGAAFHEAEAALPILPLTAAVQVGQLFLSALAWRFLLDRAVGPVTALRLRVVREGVDSLLPVAQVGGEFLSVGLLRRRGVPVALAGAGTALDLLVEAATLPVVALAGLGVLWALGGDLHAESEVLLGVLGVVALIALGVGGFALARRFGLMRLLDAIARWLPPALRVDGLQAALIARVRDRRALATAALLHVAAWSGGALEVWITLRALGHPVGFGPAFVIESIGMAARGAGFAVPGSIGVQEGGFVAAAALFGIGPETALALSALKRVREVVVGVAGLALWGAERRVRSRYRRRGDQRGDSGSLARRSAGSR